MQDERAEALGKTTEDEPLDEQGSEGVDNEGDNVAQQAEPEVADREDSGGVDEPAKISGGLERTKEKSDTIAVVKPEEDSTSQDSRSHDDVIKRAEQRKEASDIVKAAVREESERLKEIPAWENESDRSIDPRNRVGEEATKIMDEKTKSDKEVVDTIGGSQDLVQEAEPKMGVDDDSRQDRKHKERLESRVMVQQEINKNKDEVQQQSKSTNYASIDPLAEKEGNPTQALADVLLKQISIYNFREQKFSKRQMVCR